MADTRINPLPDHIIRNFSLADLRPRFGYDSTRTILQISHRLIREAANDVFGAYRFVARQNTPAVPAPIRIQEIQGDSAGD
jgi:hypothetical protein